VNSRTVDYSVMARADGPGLARLRMKEAFFDPGQPIVDLNDLADQGLKTVFEAVQSGIHAGKTRVDVRFEAAETRAGFPSPVSPSIML